MLNKLKNNWFKRLNSRISKDKGLN